MSHRYCTLWLFASLHVWCVPSSLGDDSSRLPACYLQLYKGTHAHGLCIRRSTLLLHLNNVGVSVRVYYMCIYIYIYIYIYTIHLYIYIYICIMMCSFIMILFNTSGVARSAQQWSVLRHLPTSQPRLPPPIQRSGPCSRRLPKLPSLHTCRCHGYLYYTRTYTNIHMYKPSHKHTYVCMHICL